MKAAVRPVSRRVWTSSLRNVCSHPFGDRNIGLLRKAAPWTGIARGHQRSGCHSVPSRAIRNRRPAPRSRSRSSTRGFRFQARPPESPAGRPDGPPRPRTKPGPPRPRPPSPGRGSSAGSGKRGFTNSSPWGIVPWGPWVSPPWGMEFQLPSEATCVPLAYPKRDKQSHRVSQVRT